MATSGARDKILNKIKQALATPVPVPFSLDAKTDIFPPRRDELEILFAEEFTRLQGRFAFCLDEQDLFVQLKQLIATKEWTKVFCKEDGWCDQFSTTDDLAGCDASITGCESLVARTGTIVLSAGQQSGRTVSVYAPIHVCIAYTDQLVYNVSDALDFLKEKYVNIPSLITFASGPSRTADIEKTLVTGVHGPKEVYLFLVERTQ